MIKTINLKSYKDKRGTLTENINPRIMLDSKHFFIVKSKQNTIRGNHYHKKKSEWFYVIKGTALIGIEDIKTKKKESLTITGEDKLLINFIPYQAHAIKNIGKSELILLALVNKIHNQIKPDTYPYKVF